MGKSHVRLMIEMFENKFKADKTCQTFWHKDIFFHIDDKKLISSKFSEKFSKNYEIGSLIASGANGVVLKGIWDSK